MSRYFLILFAFFSLTAIITSCTTAKHDAQLSRANMEPTGPIFNGTTVGNGAIERPRDEAIIEHLETDRTIPGLNFGGLEKLPAPELVFVFGAERRPLKGLSKNANEVVSQHWRSALKRFYDVEFHPPKSANEQVGRDHEWSIVCSATEQKLMETSIESPGGRRKISYTESSEIVGLINRLALAAVQDARASEERLPTTQM